MTFLSGYTNIIVNGVIILITILDIVVFKFLQLQEEGFEELNRRLLSLSNQGFCCRFSLHQIQRATSNFLDELVVGKGGFGKVYKGTFEPGPALVAIKRLQSMSSQGSTEFQTEIEMLSKLRHSHLVSLIGYCDDGNEMILVYEFMRGGTLADHLHKRVRQGNKSLPPLSWVQRLKVCIGAARGLEYLHTGTGIQHRVIHRDVKTTNILLDENFTAKISDFGLSKISPANQATTYVSTHVKGTPGYLDPYYFLTHRLTRKSDVYSFGIVLLEVLCGRPAVDRSLDKDQIGLAGWAEQCFRDGLVGQIIDPRIKGEVFPDSLEVFVKVAIQCLHTGPKHRPTMAEVVVYLESALALQEKSTEYYLAEIVTSDYFEDDIDFSNIESENRNSGKEMVDVSKGFHPVKQSSARFTFRKIFGALYPLTTRSLPVKRDAKTRKNSNGVLSVPANLNKFKVTDLATMLVTTNFKIFKLTDLEKATNNFEEVLGKGGSGTVFKGWVHENSYDPSTPDIGLPVAVKRFVPACEQGQKKWQMEIDISREYSHPNFVKLLGYCSEGQEHLLVYEYMQNSNLDFHIFKPSYITNKTVRKAFSWEARLKIMIGAARCLAFFHTDQAKQSVICGDFKTSRILLDEKFNAKLSPNGLERLTRSESNKDSTASMVGTLGYAAPENLKSICSDENELTGTTAIAYHLKGRIHLFVDSRVSNDSKDARTKSATNWKLKLRTREKYRVLLGRIIVLLVGQTTHSKTMVDQLTLWARAKKDTNPLLEIQVVDMVNYLENYFNQLDKEKEYEFGTIIAGYDSIKKCFQLHQFFIHKKDVYSTKIETFTCVGTGSKHVESFIAKKYRSNLSDQQSQDLAYRSILMASFMDKNTDGNVQFLEVIDTHCKIECLPLYQKYYYEKECDENCILFSFYSDSKGPIPYDKFESYFCEPEGTKASHCVDYRVSKGNEKGFYFHRLVFSSSEKVKVALDALTHSTDTWEDTNIWSKFPYLCSELHDNEIKLYVSKASIEVLTHVINNSMMK